MRMTALQRFAGLAVCFLACSPLAAYAGDSGPDFKTTCQKGVVSELKLDKKEVSDGRKGSCWRYKSPRCRPLSE